MAFRNIIVENPARIAVRNDQLLICTDAEHSVPLEDISALLLENRQITITTAALSRLGQCGGSIRKVKTDKADAMKIAKYGLDNWMDLPPLCLMNSGFKTQTYIPYSCSAAATVSW